MNNTPKLKTGDRVRLIKYPSKIACDMPEGSEGEILSIDIYARDGFKANRRAWDGEGTAFVLIKWDDPDASGYYHDSMVPSTHLIRI